MPATLKLDYPQVKGIVDQLNAEEKEKLSEYLDRLTLKSRFNKFADSFKDFSLTMDDIKEAVEEVREERHK